MPRVCKKKIPISKFDKRITLQSVAQTTDNQGGYTDVWSDGDTVWAFIEPIKGYEKFQNAQMETPVTHKITIRYNSTATTAKRVKYGSRFFNIVEMINIDEADAYMKITAVEGQME